MAHFITHMKGNRGWVSRTGTKCSGMVARVQGYDLGIEVEIIYDDVAEEDVCYIYKTGGENNLDKKQLLAIVTRDATNIKKD